MRFHCRASLTKAASSQDWALGSTSQSKGRSACIPTGKHTHTYTSKQCDVHASLIQLLFTLIPHVLQFHSEPPQQQDGEHRPPPEPSHEVQRVHQELVPERVLGPGGARAALLPLLIGGVLWGTRIFSSVVPSGWSELANTIREEISLKISFYLRNMKQDMIMLKDLLHTFGQVSTAEIKVVLHSRSTFNCAVVL